MTTRLDGSRLLRDAGIVGLACLIVIAGMVIGWRLAGPSASETSIGRVAFEVRPSLDGEVEAIVPVADWGLRADAYSAPFALRAELRSLERHSLLRAAEGDLSSLERAENDLSEAARSAVLRAFIWGGAVALALLVLATLALRPRPLWALAAAGLPLAVAAALLSMWSAERSFDARAFETPTYFAQGAELARILELAEEERVLSEYGSTFTSVLRSITAVLAEVPPEAVPGRRLVLASDLHGNPLVIDPLARMIGESPLLLAGDFGQRGGEAESALIAPRVAALGTQVVAVSGNHDSQRLMRRLAGEGVTVLRDAGTLDETGAVEAPAVIELEGLSIAGFPDPLEWDGPGDPPGRPVVFADLPDPEAAFEDSAEQLIRWFDRLRPTPDLVLVHQAALAERLAATLWERRHPGELTIATGHTHRQAIHLYGRIAVVDGGSAGAGGLFGAGEDAASFAELNFAAERPVLRSVDLIAVEPFSGEAQASRIVINRLCPDEERCSFQPPGLEPTFPGE